MDPLVFALVCHTCIRLRELLPCAYQAHFPNSVTAHWYPSADTPGEARGDCRVGWHTDSYCAPGQTTEQCPGSPVISISFGETMWFCVRRESAEWIEDAVATALEHGSVWVWLEGDDHSGVKHCVQYPSSSAARRQAAAQWQGQGRWTLIARWMKKVRHYSVEYPYRNLSGRDAVL